jgi:hypothetical protein
MGYLFDGEFGLALQSAKDGALEMGEALLKLNPATAVVANLAEAVYDNRDAIFDYTKGLIDNSKAITDNKKLLALLEIESRKMQLVNQQEAEIQRQIRDDTRKSFDERIEANKKLGEVLEKAIQQEKDLINTRIGLIQQEQELIGYTDERMLAIKNLEGEVKTFHPNEPVMVSHGICDECAKREYMQVPGLGAVRLASPEQIEAGKREELGQ